LSNHPRAREAHRLAIHHAAQIVDASTDARPAALADYAVLLREHLQRWPSSDEADRFRLQLGRIERAEGRFADAVRALSDISRDSTRYDDALVELRKCFGEASFDQWDDLPPAPVLADLATRYPDDGAIQEAHARALANSEPPEAWRRALEQFRAIEKRSPEGSARWFRAKYGIASMHLRLGDAAKAAKMVRLLKVLHPELGGPELRPQFEELLRRHGDAGEQ
jgi:tetratricopeptide (TPR) repeat protein